MPEWMKWLKERRQKREFVDGRMDLGAGPVEPGATYEVTVTADYADEEVTAAFVQMESNGDWLDDLYPSRVVDVTDEETPLPTLADLAPAPLEYVPPRGAVHNRQDIYQGGRRCLSCGVPAVADLCSRCAMGGNGNDAA